MAETVYERILVPGLFGRRFQPHLEVGLRRTGDSVVESLRDPRGLQAMEGYPDYSILVAMEKFECMVYPLLFWVYVEKKT